jgi:two-component system OmpR family response regulator
MIELRITMHAGVTSSLALQVPMTAPLKNILCIDDEQDILDIAKFALETLGNYTMEMCHSGKDALCRASMLNPDMILLDVMMPGMDGVAVYKALRQVPGLESVPIVFMTARVQPSEVIDYLDMGVEGIIPKPFDPVALPDAVASLWESRQEKDGHEIKTAV